MKKILITGGCGFIGMNSAIHFYKKKFDVYIVDNLSRKGSKTNYQYLKNNIKFKFHKVSVSNTKYIRNLISIEKFDCVIHLAAQVAVTISIADPISDFRVNTISTLNILESIRKLSPKTLLIYSSTNKVYGELQNINISENIDKYFVKSNKFYGIDENQNLDFHSPYGCSKGAADSYVIDYSRIYNLKCIVLRQSCIYGRHQYGIEDQGWLAWMMINTIKKNKFTIFGNGKQVRDILYVEDLIKLYEKIIKQYKENCRVLNVGGGIDNSISLLEYIKIMEKIGLEPKYNFSNWRSGDQKIYISDIRKANEVYGWKPNYSPLKGINYMKEWILKNI